MEGGPLCTKADYVNIFDSQLKVRDVWKNGRWALDELYTIFHDGLKQEIGDKQIDICHDDCVIWSPFLTGKYEVKSGYDWLVRNRDHQSSDIFSWRCIWQLPTIEKCKFLIWLMCHHGLPTNSLCSERGMGIMATCGRCHSMHESILHCLCDCPGALRIWQMLGFIMILTSSLITLVHGFIIKL